jgi:hypothetical protein
MQMQNWFFVVMLATGVIGICAIAIFVVARLFPNKKRPNYTSSRRARQETRQPIPFATLNALWERSRAEGKTPQEGDEQTQQRPISTTVES